MYQALYRKWRPQIFSDVSGQPHVTQTLKNEIESGRFSHAYLFTGSRGTGKTTCAKILAKAVNCTNPQDGDPCNECDSCRGIDNGSILDVTEIDAASNNGVENIRELREEVSFTPVNCKFRVYIIDEVHMLSISAFNALLKTLEEPPKHVMFILATTEVNKLPATILSRCQRFDFRRISVEDIASRLSYVAENEGVILEESAALFIARLADGALRDALSLLDQCVGQTKNITSQTVAQVAGLAGKDYLFEISNAIIQTDTEKLLSTIDTLYKNSCDMERLCSELIEHFRNLMITKSVSKAESLISVSIDELNKYKSTAENLTIERIINVLDILQETLAKLHDGANGRVEMEMTAVKLSSPKLSSNISALIERVAKLEKELKAGLFSQNIENAKIENHPPQKTDPPVQESVTIRPQVSCDSNSVQVEKETKETVVADKSNIVSESYRNDILLQQWPDILEELKKVDVSVLSILTDSRAHCRGDFILIDSPNPLFSEFIKRKGYVASIKKAVYNILGKDYKLGIYKKADNSSSVKTDPLQVLEQRAKNLGINVTIKE